MFWLVWSDYLRTYRCSVLQCVAVCGSVLQCAVERHVLHAVVQLRAHVVYCFDVRCSALPCVAACCCAVQCVAE